MQASHWICRDDDDDTIVNDKRAHRCTQSRPLKYTPSALCLAAEREATEAAAREELIDSLLALKPFLVKKLHFPPLSSPLSIRDERYPPEASLPYKPIAKAVGRIAFRLGKWFVSSQFVW